MKKRVGIFQLPDGTWGYRARVENQFDIRRTRDRNGLVMKTAAAAEKERNWAIANELQRRRDKEAERYGLKNGTVADVYERCIIPESQKKAYGTVCKQKSLWKIHFRERWGQRDIKSLSAGEVNLWLADIMDDDYAYSYVEGFLRFFYVIIGTAYRHNYINRSQYAKLCEDKKARITMPCDKPRHDIVVYNREEMKQLDNFFRCSTVETAYLIGKYCGLRINETFGLKWDHVDFKGGYIKVDRQQQYIDGILSLIKPKTKNAYRNVVMPQALINHLLLIKSELAALTSEEKQKRELRSRRIIDIDGTVISATELVNCSADGTLYTRNSFKYHARELKKHGIEFRYHNLRHTYGSRMANAGVPQHLLLKMMGHGSIQVTQQYYLGMNDEGVDIIKKKLEEMEEN